MRTLSIVLALILTALILPASASASCQCDKMCLGDQSCDPGDGEEPCTGMTCHINAGMCFEAFCFAVNDAAQEIQPCGVLTVSTVSPVFDAAPACVAR